MAVSVVFLFTLLAFQIPGDAIGDIVKADTLPPEPEPKSLNEFEASILSKLIEERISNLARPRTNLTDVTQSWVQVDMQKITVKPVPGNEYYWEAHMELTQTWTDERLAYDTTDFPKYSRFRLDSPRKYIWTPDTYIPNSIESASAEPINSSMEVAWILPNGVVLYSSRRTVTMYCRRSTTSKNANCPLVLSSYGYTMDELTINWSPSDPIRMNEQTTSKVGNFRLTQQPSPAGGFQLSRRLGNFYSIYADFVFVKQ